MWLHRNAWGVLPKRSLAACYLACLAPKSPGALDHAQPHVRAPASPRFFLGSRYGSPLPSIAACAGHEAGEECVEVYREHLDESGTIVLASKQHGDTSLHGQVGGVPPAAHTPSP